MTFDINELQQDYLTVDDTIWTETEDIDNYKRVILTGLTDTERRLILLYTHLQSQRKVATLLHVSPATINRLIKDIRNKIIQTKQNEYGSDDSDFKHTLHRSGNNHLPVQTLDKEDK